MEYLCSICQNPYQPRSWQEHFCNDCYTKYKEAIFNHAPWVEYCIKNERDRRRWDTYVHEGRRVSVWLIYLGSEFDVSADGQLVPLEEHFTNE